MQPRDQTPRSVGIPPVPVGTPPVAVEMPPRPTMPDPPRPAESESLAAAAPETRTAPDAPEPTQKVEGYTGDAIRSEATAQSSTNPAEQSPPPLAETLLRAAQNLERANKVRGALEFYRRVEREYPGTPQAKRAAERIKVLTMP
jgi:hypothetical protein